MTFRRREKVSISCLLLKEMTTKITDEVGKSLIGDKTLCCTPIHFYIAQNLVNTRHMIFLDQSNP